MPGEPMKWPTKVCAGRSKRSSALPTCTAGEDPPRTDWALEIMRGSMRADIRPTSDATLADWLAAADGFATGGANDKKLAGQMRDAVPPATTLQAMTPIFIDSKGVARDRFGTSKAPPGASTYLADISLKYLSTLDRARAARVADETRKVLTLAGVHAALYEAAKRARGALDFTDLVGRTVELLTRRASAAWVLYKLDGGIEHVLIDEAQDTAPDQWDIVRSKSEKVRDFFLAAPGGVPTQVAFSQERRWKALDLDREGGTVTFQIVAQKAQVSRSWLYTQPDICAEIRRLRDLQRGAIGAPLPASHRSTDTSLRRRLEVANARVRDLTTESQRLRKQLEHALGQLQESTTAR